MRVVFFNRSYYPDFGATGQLLTELCEDLVERYHYDVTVVAGMPLAAESPVEPMRWYKPIRREERNGVRVLRVWGTSLPPRRMSGRIANYLSYFSGASLAALPVSTQLESTPPVSAQTPPPFSSGLARL